MTDSRGVNDRTAPPYNDWLSGLAKRELRRFNSVENPLYPDFSYYEPHPETDWDVLNIR